MDDAKIKKILENIDVPAVDANEKKIDVNVAMSAFEDHQKEKQKKSQGFSILSRLIRNNTNKKRRDTMEKKFRKKLLYGSAVTALGLALVAGPIISNTMLSTIGTGSAVEESPVRVRGGGSNNFNSIASNIVTSPSIFGSFKKEEKVSRKDIAPATQRAALETRNRENLSSADMAESFIPLPLSSTVARAPAAKVAGFSSTLKNLAPSQDHIVSTHVDEGRDKFEDFKVNPIKQVGDEPVSTFSVDVDTASYSFMRKQINNGRLPQKDSVRVEELINYFDYDYAVPDSKSVPFKPTVNITDSPWAEGKKLIHIGIKGYDIEGDKPKSNLVFLLDVSGSMNAQDKLPLVKNSMKMLLDTLNNDDTVSIVVYAGAAGAVLQPTKVSERSKIYAAFDNLSAGGSTAGAAGIKLAYQLAEQNFDKDAVNRVILATDGDFNVGITNRDELQDFVERKRETGIFLSVLGFGQGNYNDHMMQVLAQNGNGVAAYIDSLNEARKVLVEEATSSLFTIAKDVKIQVEFNPDAVSEYRLVGYETRALKREDFNNDKVDAGDIGAGHTVTAIYEITPVDSQNKSVDGLRYGAKTQLVKRVEKRAVPNEYAFLKLRYKLPNEDTSKLITTPITRDAQRTIVNKCSEQKIESGLCDINPMASGDVAFATAVAAFGQILKGGEHTGSYSYDDVIKLAQQGKGDDVFGYRAEFINLVRLAQSAPSM